MSRFLILLFALGIIITGVVEWANSAWNEPGPAARQGGETVVLIAPHTRLTDIAQKLQDAHVLNYGLAFAFDVTLRQQGSKIKAGEYAIPSRASMAGIAAILVSGKSIQHKLTAAEGLTSDMIYKLVVADPVLTGDAGPEPEEGTLLPETYLFTRGATRAEMLDRMRKAQEKFLDQAWSGRTQGLPIQSRHDAVTLASVVEKETSLPEERRHIASVFINRLKVGMKLQSDPTIIYGITKGYPLGRGIRESEIQADTPYNTYVIAALPAGPICNPGKDSIAAVLKPEVTDDLFFVATGRGGHVFSATISEHERNVIAYRAVERLKEGNDIVPDAPAVTLPQLPVAKTARRHRHS
jgi:UPF0755 protein